MTLILGSSSPRRREILEFFSLPFHVKSPPFDESSVIFRGDPKAHVTTIANEKAKSLAATFPNEPILAADTMVFLEGKMLGKPDSEKEMKEMLNALSGRWHSVFTALALFHQGKLYSDIEETKVHCNQLTPEEIHAYMRHHSLHDKAGAYAIQKSGSLIVKEIHGCYYNVMGLPINCLTRLLRHAKIDLWHNLKKF